VRKLYIVPAVLERRFEPNTSKSFSSNKFAIRIDCPRTAAERDDLSAGFIEQLSEISGFDFAIRRFTFSIDDRSDLALFIFFDKKIQVDPIGP